MNRKRYQKLGVRRRRIEGFGGIGWAAQSSGVKEENPEGGVGNRNGEELLASVLGRMTQKEFAFAWQAPSMGIELG